MHNSAKRIAFVSHTTNLSGAAMSYYTLLTGLNKTQYTCIPILPDKGPLYQQLQDSDYSPMSFVFQGLQKYLVGKQVKQYLKNQNVDIIYLSCAHKYCRMVARAASVLGIPIVWHVREPPLGNRVQKNIRYMKRFGARVIVVSKEQQNVLAPHLYVEKVDNGVDNNRFDRGIDGSSVRQKYGITDSDFLYGIVGTIEKRKNTEHFILAAKKIRQVHKNAKFLVVGSGSAEYVKKMHRLVRELDLGDDLAFTGRAWNVPEIMAALDVLVMPSMWEAFPRVVIEGMMMAKPVIASDVGDVSYIIDDRENGFIVPEADEKILSDTMLYAIENPQELKEISQKAYAKAEANFTQKIHVEKMQGIFSALLEANSVKILKKN